MLDTVSRLGEMDEQGTLAPPSQVFSSTDVPQSHLGAFQSSPWDPGPDSQGGERLCSVAWHLILRKSPSDSEASDWSVWGI